MNTDRRHVAKGQVKVLEVTFLCRLLGSWETAMA